MSAASLLVHLQALGLTRGTALAGDRLMLGLVLMTLLIVSGRVLPSFTRAAVQGAQPKVSSWVERLTFGLAGLWVLGDVVAAGTPLAGGLALALAAVQVLRFAGWYRSGVLANAMLWVLYSGYLWLILGLLLNGLAHLDLVAPFPSMHALTVGAIGIFTLGMMSRVTLGHTGRPMRAPTAVTAAFWTLNLAALTRVFGPLLWPAAYGTWLLVSGVLWTFAFGLFLWVHGPMLILPRADGRPG